MNPQNHVTAHSGNLGDLIRSDARPEWRALVDGVSPRREWVYRELDASAESFARALICVGIAVGDRVAILAENCAEYLIAYMGIMRAGAVCVPVNFRLSVETVRFILADCAAQLCIVDADRATLVTPGLPCLRIGDQGPDGFANFLGIATGTIAPRRPAPDTSEILYTSGSTGRPKGVVLSHAGQLWALGVHTSVKPERSDRSLIVAPLYHMNALFHISVCLMNAIDVVLLPRFEACSYLAAVAEHRCTRLSGIPSMFALMARQPELLSTLDLTCVRTVIIGSAPLTDALITRVRAMFPNATVSNGYGTTEAGPSIFGEHPCGLPRPILSLGHPLPRVEVRLASESDTQGVLQIRAPAMFTEYLNLPEVTGEKLRDGWYDTGDIVRRDADNFFYFVGRADDMFVCGGENVFPSEIEKMLERHPAVLQAAVVAVPDEVKGEIPIAFVVLKELQLPLEELKRFALANGPAFSHPRAFIAVDELPVASTHKLDKRPLREKALEVAHALNR